SDRGRVRPGHPMHDRAVLDVGAPADADPMHVAAQDHRHPDTALFPDFDVADDLSAVVDEGGGVDPGYGSAVRAEHYGIITGSLGSQGSRGSRGSRGSIGSMGSVGSQGSTGSLGSHGFRGFARFARFGSKGSSR